MYSKTEIHNLTRFIAAMKFRPLIWRNTHPYILADRVEDISDPEQVRQNPMIDRTISFYGYVHGTHFKRGMRAQVYCRRDCNVTTMTGMKVHIPGSGDHEITSIRLLPDPCPAPDQDPERKKRQLNEKGLL